MLKRIGFPLLAVVAMLVLIGAPQAQAKVRFGVVIGGPAYTYVPPVDPYAYADPAPYYGYANPYPDYSYVAPYPAPVYAYPYNGWRARRYHELQERREHEYREHERRERFGDMRYRR